eukprot:gene1683-3255_t
MAKKLLLNVLVDFLGDYVDGLSEENLRLGVWSGKVVLNNLQLNRKTLQNWYLPISVAHGSVRNLEVVIPWATLDSNPVRVILDGVYLQVGPLDASSFDSLELQKQAFILKRHRLQQAEKAFEISAKMMENDDQKDRGGRSMTYIQRLTANIIDNIEVTLQNIHIRYEDSRTIPGNTFSAGITLDSFVVTTTDQNWLESFVSRTSVLYNNSIHKMATMTNLGVYWNSQENKPIANLPFSEWELEMHALIYTHSGNNQKQQQQQQKDSNIPLNIPLRFILAPPNVLTVRFIHNEIVTDFTPRFDVSVESTNLPLKLDQSQYTQLMSTANILAALDRQKQLYLHRPLHSVVEDPRAWWIYALKLVTKRGDILTKNVDTIMLCLRSRNRYIALLKLSRVLDASSSGGEDMQELLELEKILPLHALIVFRKLIVKEAADEARSHRRRERGNSQWEGWWWGGGRKKTWTGSTDEEEEDDDDMDEDLTLESLGMGLNRATHASSSSAADINSNASFHIKFALKSSSYLELFVNGVAYADVRMSLSVEAEVRTGTTTAVFSLNNLIMTDVITQNPVIKNIIAVQTSAFAKQSSKPMIRVAFENTNGKASVRITALPFELTWNRLCIQKILGMFLYYTRHAGSVMSLNQPVVGAREQHYPTQQNQGGTTSPMSPSRPHHRHRPPGIDVIFEADAPKLIFPEDSCSERGYVLLDTGYLAVKGNMGPFGMWWDVSLRSINAGMPRTVHDMYLFGEQSLYLIKPFNLTLSAQNIVKSVADMTCHIKVDPEVRGELDDSKLARLLVVVQIVSQTFVTAIRGDDLHPPPSPGSDSGDVNKAVEVQIEDSPLHRTLDVTLQVPELALDLQYDMMKGHHLFLSVKTLQTHLVMRPYDLQWVFDLNTLSIQDSQRCLDQRDLARTPATEKMLVHVSYIYMTNRKSPCFVQHGTEVVVNFAEIALNVDHKTLLHLRPFYEVLLGRRDYSPSADAMSTIPPINSSQLCTTARLTDAIQYAKEILAMTQQSSSNTNRDETKTIHTNSLSSSSQYQLLPIPKTMHVVCTLGKISLDMLQIAVTNDNKRNGFTGSASPQLPLLPMFCLEVAGLTADVCLTDLIKADVRLQTVDVIDRRESSREYAFKTILTPDPLQDTPAKLPSKESSSSSSAGTTKAGSGNKGHSPFLDDVNFLTILYTQESRRSSFVDIVVRNVTSFVSLDSVLDLVNVSVANAFAVLDLVAPVHVSSSTSAYGVNGTDAVSYRNFTNGVNDPPKLEKYLDPITISVRVRIPTSRLILLEDPTTLESRAVVGRCGIEVTYVREVKGGYTREIHEALHVSTVGTEVFVLMNMQNWNPLQILEPLGLEFHMSRMLERGMVISVGCTLDTDAVDARVSLNDLALAQSILLRRTLTTSADNVTLNNFEDTGDDQHGIQVTVYDIVMNIGSVYLVTINDFNGQNVPILRLQLEGSNFSCDGVIQHLKGQGDMIASVDFYNMSIASWEPVMERWHAAVCLETTPDGTYLTVTSNHTMQLTISGVMLETLLQTYSQLLRLDDVQSRDEAPDVTIRNQLGVPLEVFDSRTNSRLLSLTDDSLTLMKRSQSVLERGAGSGQTRLQIPILMDIFFLGKINEERLPLYHLPLNIKTSKTYQLRPVGGDISSNPMEAVSIVEEIFENQRYDPVLVVWRPPFLFQDPYEWTNSEGNKLNMADIELPSDEWEWQDEWKVDYHGVGEEVDSEGWEYALNFAFFTNSNRRRAMGSLDYARRRRWVRTRVPRPAPIDDPTRPLTVFWDVTTKSNGSKSVLIRSGYQVVNYMPFPVTISMSSSVWDEDYIFGPIGQNVKFGVPLLNAYASGIKVKPADMPYDWCRRLLCGMRMQDFKETYDVKCNSPSDMNPICIRMVFKQVNRSLLLTLLPYVIIQNRLPCEIFFKCSSLADPTKVEEGLLSPGNSCKLIHIDLVCKPQISFRAGVYQWSYPQTIDCYNPTRIDMDLFLPNGEPALVLSMRSKKGQGQSAELCVFTKGILVDRTGLDLCVRSLNAAGDFMVTRKTFLDIRRSHTISTSSPVKESNATNSHPHSLDVDFTGSATSPHSGSIPVGPLLLKSRRRYLLTTADVGDLVYTDRDLRWTNLPPALRGQTFLSTPCEDRSMRVNNLIQFTTSRSVVVFILYDHRNSMQPPWLIHQGFRRISETATARRVAQGTVYEHHYVAWGKAFQAGQWVTLGCTGSKDCRSMYVAFVVPATSPQRVFELLEQVPSDTNVKREEAQSSWLMGGNGLTMFFAADGNIAIGINRGVAWCEQVHTQLISSSKGLFEAIDRRTGRGYQLAYSLSSMPGIFRRTQVVTVMPRFCIVNCMDEAIEIRQQGTQETLFIEPFHAEGWHKADAMKGSMVQIRCQSSMWSFGAVDVNEVGSTVLLLPGADRTTFASQRLSVAHIEVKLAERTENCAVLVVIWRGSVESGVSLSIRNDSDVPVVVQQANVNYRGSRVEGTMFEMSVLPGTWVPFGWTDPQAGSSVMVAVGASLAAAGKRVATIEMMHVGAQLRLPDNSRAGAQSEVLLAVQTSGSGRMLRIVRRPEELSVGETVRKRGIPSSELSVCFSLSSIGVSLVVEKPIRREFLSMYAEGLACRVVTKGPVKTYEFVLRDLQVDNYSETCIHPVLLHSSKEGRRHHQGYLADAPLMQIAVIQDTPVGSSLVHYRYIAVRVLELELAVDSSTIQLLISDLISDLEFVSRDQALASRVPEKWIEEYNIRMVSQEDQRQLVDVYKSQIVAQASKMYFQELILHPMKITLTYAQTPFPRKKETDNLSVSAAVLEVLTSMAGVDRMVIKLNSFIVSEAIESVNSLSQRIISKTMRDLQFQLAQMAGSLTMIGSPVGLARNIGNGVQDFFYEPYQGLVQSPQEFVIGLGKGTSSLVAGVVAGALNSTVAIVGTASKGIALLSGDPEFVRTRALQQQRSQAARGGVLAGAQDGVASVYSGFASGISGLFTKPIEEAKRDGTVGFLRGVGLGVIGAAVKPLLGVTDGLASVAQGISNQVGDSAARLQARPPRAFERSEADAADLRLVPVDILAAYAQEFVLKRAMERGYKDAFICRVSTHPDGVQAVILSEMYVYWRRQANKLWGRSWADISHCLFSDEGVGLMMYGSGSKQSALITCADREHSIMLYTALARNADRMGNPANVVPVEVATQSSFQNSGDRYSGRPGRVSGPEGELDGYKFGTANKTRLSKEIFTEKEVLIRAQNRLNVGYIEWSKLDDAVWQLIWEWDHSHSGLHASRCCACILINSSNSPIQLARTQVVEGRGLQVLSCQRFDEESRSIAPNGVVVLFAYAYSPSPIDVGHVKVLVFTPAFTATLSSRKRDTKCESQGGFATGFLEKTLDRWWSKNVILIT